MSLSVTFQLLKSARVQRTEVAEADLAALAHFVFTRERLNGVVNVTLELTHPRRIQSLNRHFRGVDRNTDVISFRYDRLALGRGAGGDGRCARGSFDGDIAINVEQARLQAAKMRHSARREIRLLWIHGLLHLLGYTDYQPGPRRRMFQRQNVLLRQWERQAGG